nr:leucyl aminopeptidase [Lachnospiraceae bacterium]
MEKSVYEFDEALDERRELSFGRIKEIPSEVNVPEPFMQYFREVAEFILDPSYDIALPENYEVCWSNPRYAVLMLGEKLGRLLCYLSYELMGIIPFRAEGLKLDEVILMEVFIQVYGAFEAASLDGTLPDEKEIKGILYSFVSDYMDHTVYERIKGSVEGDNDFALRIIQDSDLSDLSYLEKYGEYVSDNTIGTAKYLNSLSDEKIELMAAAFTNGYITGFANTGKDIKKKKTVNLRYHIGFERLVRAEIRLFKEAGLSPVIYRRALHVAVRGNSYVGYYGDQVNPQMDYDHREDKALFLDKAYVNRKLEVSRFAYEQVKDKARVMGGPAVMETFGEKPFKPEQKSEAPVMSEKQRRLDVELTSKLGSMVNEYIPRDERSFSIIAYPVPEIGDDYEKIFTETVKLNTLDCKLY